ITIFGTEFASGAAVTIGGQPATAIDVVNDGQINATSPALPAGSVNDLVVTNTDGTSGTLSKGWVSDFLDVDSGNQFYSYVTKLVRRDSMAVLLLKTEHGSSYAPPACAGICPDVPCSSPFAPWIEQLFNEQVTGGCGGGNYCPSAANTRGQMAVFMVKTFHLQ